MLNDYSEGGLKMFDIESFDKDLKMTWVKKYLDKENHSKWKIFDLEVKNNGESTILTGNLNKKDINKFYCLGDPFLKEIIEILSELNYEQYITSKEQLHAVTTSVA